MQQRKEHLRKKILEEDARVSLTRGDGIKAISKSDIYLVSNFFCRFVSVVQPCLDNGAISGESEIVKSAVEPATASVDS